MRTSTRTSVLSLLAALLWLAAAPSGAWQAPSPPDQDQLFGTWRLILERSRYQPGPAPKSETRIYEPDGTGVKATIRRVLADGRPEVVEYSADFDNPSPVTGSADIDRILMKRIDAYTAESVLSHAGRVFATARRVVARDGKSMTITVRREGNERVNNVAYYEREMP